ncbi:MAG TPA: hypothetical protein VK524_28270 [Polyangiaceae bacterium]|nr:hypothetical protein [Polyangiaceae bacterium]
MPSSMAYRQSRVSTSLWLLLKPTVASENNNACASRSVVVMPPVRVLVSSALVARNSSTSLP